MRSVIAIVGRPNVGKSTLFNRLVGERRALVDDRPGATRDRNYGTAEWQGREVIFIDTGGFEPDLSALPEGALFAQVRTQAEAAIEEADLVLFVVDRKAGLTPADKLTADVLRRSGRGDRVVLVVNKVDGPRHEDEAAEFWALGMEPMVCVSGEHGRGMYELWDEILPRLPEDAEAEPDDEESREIRVAVLGHPNVGKSTLVNQILGEERQVVHDMAGTTMDAVDSVLRVGDRNWRIVDTAGIRRKARIGDKLETRATLQAIRTIERCHVTLLMIDGTAPPSNQDARLAGLITDRGRACVLLVNRWDLVRRQTDRNMHVVTDEIERSFPHLSWAPRLFISALTGKGVGRILPLAEQCYGQFDRRVSTARANRFLEEAVEAHSPPQRYHHPVRLNYITQARVRPPTFVIWSNTPEAIKAPYKRYLINRMRAVFGFAGTPIRVHFRKKRKPGAPK